MLTAVFYPILAIGTLLSGIGALSAWRRSRRLEGTPPYRQLTKLRQERDQLLVDNRRLRAQCRRLLTECSELKTALAQALKELVRLTR